MELVTLAQHMIQDVAEQAASYRLGQTALRHLDRALWVVEKCARWAVPPPLEDDKPQPELVRPLPWVFFLAMLIALRVTRESISLVNLILGKPPLRSADVVMYIQSKRRYLRTLKYQGNRKIRARNAPQNEPWYSGIQALFEFTMCFRRSQNYGNNNTTRVSNNDEVLVIKSGKRNRESPAAGASVSENTMERLIEKMMVDLDADSDDDSSFTLTNATSVCSEESDTDTLENHNAIAESTINSTTETARTEIENLTFPSQGDFTGSTPERTFDINKTESPKENKQEEKREEQNGIEKEKDEKSSSSPSKAELPEPLNSTEVTTQNKEEKSPKKQKKEKQSAKEDINNFLQSERCSPQKQSSKQTKFGMKIANAFRNLSKKHERIETLANGRTMSVPSNKKKVLNQRRDSDSTPVARVSPADEAY